MHKLHEHLPDFIADIYDIDSLLNTEQVEVEELYNARYELLDDIFVNTARDYGLKRFEKIYGLNSNDSMSVEERRFNIKTAMTDKLPATKNYLIDSLKRICGEDGCSVTVDNTNYTISINLVLPSESTERIVREFIQKVIPANMELIFSVDYTENSKMQYKEG